MNSVIYINATNMRSYRWVKWFIVAMFGCSFSSSHCIQSTGIFMPAFYHICMQMHRLFTIDLHVCVCMILNNLHCPFSIYIALYLFKTVPAPTENNFKMNLTKKVNGNTFWVMHVQRHGNLHKKHRFIITQLLEIFKLSGWVCDKRCFPEFCKQIRSIQDRKIVIQVFHVVFQFINPKCSHFCRITHSNLTIQIVWASKNCIYTLAVILNGQILV